MPKHRLLGKMIPSRTNSPPAEVSTKGDRVRVMVFNATFNNISVIVWRSVLLVEETGLPEENHRPAESRLQTSSHNVVSSTPRHFH